LAINITASLTEQLHLLGFDSWISDLGSLVKEGRVELTGTASYHPILPKLPESEISRQIQLNKAINRRYFGDVFNPVGFFPPEMAIDTKTLSIIDSLGYSWVSVDETAISDFLPITPIEGKCQSDLVVRVRDQNAKLIVRDRELSLKIAFGEINNTLDLNRYLENKGNCGKNRYILALDGETFGHHRPSSLLFLKSLFAESGKSYSLRTISEQIANCSSVFVPDIKRSTWGKGWDIWDNPNNEIHRNQWFLTRLAIETINNSPYRISGISDNYLDDSSISKGGLSFEWNKARHYLDMALQSDQYWWASGDPNWHYEMVKRGAEGLVNSIKSVPKVDKRVILQAENLYSRIIEYGKAKFGEGVVL
jgi:hypothetical protein